MKHLSEILVYEHANHNALSHLTINTEGRLWGADFSAGQMGTFQSALIRLAIASFIIHYLDWHAESDFADKHSLHTVPGLQRALDRTKWRLYVQAHNFRLADDPRGIRA